MIVVFCLDWCVVFLFGFGIVYLYDCCLFGWFDFDCFLWLVVFELDV